MASFNVVSIVVSSFSRARDLNLVKIVGEQYTYRR